ncbi:MAG: hypothetical protein ACYC45_02430 [Acidithiobacillus ferriphilus]
MTVTKKDIPHQLAKLNSYSGYIGNKPLSLHFFEIFNKELKR